jgi:hypothetical protein
MDELPEMSSSSLKKILWDKMISKEQKFALIQDFLPQEAIECLKE